MPVRKSEQLSAQLKETRNKLAEYRHCGLLLNYQQIEAFVGKFDEFIDMARALENGASLDPTNVNIGDVAISGNIIAFPGSAPSHRPTGGAA